MAFFLGDGLNAKSLARRIWREGDQDNISGRAAELAFYFTLSLFPLLIFLLSLLSQISGLQRQVFDWISATMPVDAARVIESWVQEVFRARGGGLLSLGLFLSLGSGSSGMAALIAALNAVYEVKETRPFWKTRLLALALTIEVCLLVIGGAVLITLGDDGINWITKVFHLTSPAGSGWWPLRDVIAIVATTLGLQVIYCFAPNARQKWRWISPGAIFAVASFFLASYLLSIYLRVVPSYSVTYGSIGAFIVLMLWLYIFGLAILLGGEINSEIEKAARAAK